MRSDTAVQRRRAEAAAIETDHGRAFAQVNPVWCDRIPIWLGTYGPRALALTGRLPDVWIPSLGFAPPDQVRMLRDRVLAAAAAAGRDPAELTCAYNVEVRVDERPSDTPSVVTGPADAVTEQLVGFVGLGFTALNLLPVGPDTAEQVERLAREVVPAVLTALGP
jgi:alkanesulfonate monooxygenase SsuD/methylene tetrahydromethanopterin reductase-like flavin-dependent oxidoreductase (luciferase family)